MIALKKILIPKHVKPYHFLLSMSFFPLFLIWGTLAPALAGEVTLSWDPNNEKDLAGYRIYKRTLPSLDYGSPISVGLTGTPSAPSKVITGLPEDVTVGFAVTAYDTSGNESAPSVEKTITLAPGCSPPSPKSEIRINFQPNTAKIPSGYTNDSGELFTACRGYGWSTSLTNQAIDRNKNSDQRLDTFLFVNSNSSSTWNINLPTGQYLISLASGDAGAQAGPLSVSLEGLPIFQNLIAPKNSYLSFTNLPIPITDGNLTIKLGTASGKSILNYIIIRPM